MKRLVLFFGLLTLSCKTANNQGNDVSNPHASNELQNIDIHSSDLNMTSTNAQCKELIAGTSLNDQEVFILFKETAVAHVGKSVECVLKITLHLPKNASVNADIATTIDNRTSDRGVALTVALSPDGPTNNALRGVRVLSPPLGLQELTGSFEESESEKAARNNGLAKLKLKIKLVLADKTVPTTDALAIKQVSLKFK